MLMPNAPLDAARPVAERLRDAGFQVLRHGGGGSFKSQMKKADASGAALAVIIGDDESLAGEVSFKPMRVEAAQQRLPLALAIAQMKEA